MKEKVSFCFQTENAPLSFFLSAKSHYKDIWERKEWISATYFEASLLAMGISVPPELDTAAGPSHKQIQKHLSFSRAVLKSFGVDSEMYLAIKG